MKKENIKKEKKKIDKTIILKKVLASILVILTLLGTCYTFIYLVINS